MSNTITIKDPNGNIVCSVENVDPVKSEEGIVGNFFKGLALGFSTITACLTGYFALLLLIVLLDMGINGAKEKIDASYAKKILKQLDPNYINGLKKELKQIIEDENRIINEIALDVESYAMKNKDISVNCADITIQYFTNRHDGKINEKEANKYLNKRIVDIVNAVKKPKEMDYDNDSIELIFANVSENWWDETEYAIYELKDYLKTFANNKKYSSKYIDHVNVSFHDCSETDGNCWFAFKIGFVHNKEEMNKLLKPIVDAINS